MEKVKLSKKIDTHLRDTLQVFLIADDVKTSKRLVLALENAHIRTWADKENNMTLLVSALQNGYEVEISKEERLLVELESMMQAFREAQENYIEEIRAQDQTERADSLERSMNEKVENCKQLIEEYEEEAALS
ncbi:hypothetical protein NLX67_17660 [Domibacillus sp. A3M-37]|uniref:hypothetical protein n=1 Tax=Domibacillus TaxID=1433999 RepID=UPI0020B759E2|nr:hypothetical protein [Domibacillus sp. A3M-37]MCP3764177.1 hypothetical protein [Domibacillus sp. A3M-37]